MHEIAATSNGRMTVSNLSYVQGVASRITFPVTISNIVARINGSSDPNRAYVVTGHYDSRRIDILDYTNDAPGADDDATGVAGEFIWQCWLGRLLLQACESHINLLWS